MNKIRIALKLHGHAIQEVHAIVLRAYCFISLFIQSFIFVHTLFYAILCICDIQLIIYVHLQCNGYNLLNFMCTNVQFIFISHNQYIHLCTYTCCALETFILQAIKRHPCFYFCDKTLYICNHFLLLEKRHYAQLYRPTSSLYSNINT